MNSAIILVDIQNDFLPGGALPVPNGREIIPVVNNVINKFNGLVVGTQDWHPKNHGSFASQHNKNPYETIDLFGINQVLWPDHCVQYSYGASFATSLNTTKIQKVFPKGVDPNVDSYSGFFDNARRHSTGLHEYLSIRGIKSVEILGLATDYCVKATALDAISLGYNTTLVIDGCRGVNISPMDSEIAIREIMDAGGNIS